MTRIDRTKSKVTPITAAPLQYPSEQIEGITAQASRVFDNARAFRVLNKLIIPNKPISPGVLRLLELLVDDLEDVADELDNWVQI
jgi:hypothetical protein